MTDDPMDTQEHELPAFEAVIAASMALMTAYSQALQAELHPQHRLAMGRKIVAHLDLLHRQPALSAGFGEVLRTLQRCWQTMHACTQDAARGSGGFGDAEGCGLDCDGDCARQAAAPGEADAGQADPRRISHRGGARCRSDPKQLH